MLSISSPTHCWAAGRTKHCPAEPTVWRQTGTRGRCTPSTGWPTCLVMRTTVKRHSNPKGCACRHRLKRGNPTRDGVSDPGHAVGSNVHGHDRRARTRRYRRRAHPHAHGAGPQHPAALLCLVLHHEVVTIEAELPSTSTKHQRPGRKNLPGHCH